MKHIKLFEEFLNEGYRKRNNIEEYNNALRVAHPRSRMTEIFIKKVEDLLNGKAKEYARNEFKLGMGTQWGYEWVDSLVEHGVLGAIKKGRKVYIVPANNSEVIALKNNKIIEDIISNAKYKERMGGNINDVRWQFNEKLSSFKFKIQYPIVTWIHWEKGHGDYVDKDEINSHKKDIEESLESWYIVNFIKTELKRHFKNVNSKITYRGESSPTRIGADSHKGFIYTVEYEIKFE